VAHWAHKRTGGPLGAQATKSRTKSKGIGITESESASQALGDEQKTQDEPLALKAIGT
jgi:hypothetical protein